MRLIMQPTHEMQIITMVLKGNGLVTVAEYGRGGGYGRLLYLFGRSTGHWSRMQHRKPSRYPAMAR